MDLAARYNFRLSVGALGSASVFPDSYQADDQNDETDDLEKAERPDANAEQNEILPKSVRREHMPCKQVKPHGDETDPKEQQTIE